MAGFLQQRLPVRRIPVEPLLAEVDRADAVAANRNRAAKEARFSMNRKPLLYRNIIAGIILGLINFGSTFYILKAMGIFKSSVVFPITNAGIVSLSALIGYFFFREKLKLVNWIGIGLAIIAIIMIANA